MLSLCDRGWMREGRKELRELRSIGVAPLAACVVVSKPPIVLSKMLPLLLGLQFNVNADALPSFTIASVLVSLAMSRG